MDRLSDLDQQLIRDRFYRDLHKSFGALVRWMCGSLGGHDRLSYECPAVWLKEFK